MALNMSFVARAAAATALPVLASTAHAAIVPVNFTVTPTAGQTFLSSSFQQAVQSVFQTHVDRVTGQFNYDTTTIGLLSSNSRSNSGTYALSNPFNINFYSGTNLLFSETANPSASSNILVYESTRAGNESYVTVSINSGTFDNSLFSGSGINYSLQSVTLDLIDANRTVITSNALPSTSVWQGLPTEFSMSFGTGSSSSAQTASALLAPGSLVVPEPAPLALLATGLLALGWQVRRKNR